MNKNVIYGYDIYDPRVPCPCSHLKLPACSCVFLFPTVFFIGKCFKGCPQGPPSTVQNCLLRRSRPRDRKLAHSSFFPRCCRIKIPVQLHLAGGGAEDCDLEGARGLTSTPSKIFRSEPAAAARIAHSP